MSVLTLAEFKLRTRDKLLAGIAEEIITTNPIWNFMPWQGYAGTGLIVNKEKTLGDANFYGLDDTITSKAPSAVAPVTFTATRVIGDAELDMLQVAESNSDINNLMAMEVASKSKSIGRLIQEGMVAGSGTDPKMNSFHSMVDSGQYVTSSGSIFDDLDALTQKVLSKDGITDFIMLNGAQALKLRTAYRALGGVPMVEVKVGNKTFQVMDFNGIPVFTNNWIGSKETAGGGAMTGGALTSIYAGVFDDGTQKTGVSMIHPQATPMGISIENYGKKQDKDQEIIRLKSYCNFASFNKVGVARLTDVAA